MNRPNPEPNPASDNRYVSTAQVAQALGVSVTTVKRWVDENVLPAHRTAGGHRKLLMADVVRAVRQGNLPHADLSRLAPITAKTPTDIEEIYKQFGEATRAVDTEQIRAVLLGAYHNGVSLCTLADRVIAPVMMQVGNAWHAGKLNVMKEHRISQALITVLYELRVLLRAGAEKDRPIAIGGAPEDDHSSISSLLAKLVLMECGWDAINLGPHTPMSAFRNALVELKPQLVWLTVTHLNDPEKFITEYTEFYHEAEVRGIAVAIGGMALKDTLRVRMPYTTFGDGLTHLAAFARSLHRPPQRPKRGRPTGSKKTEDGSDEAENVS